MTPTDEYAHVGRHADILASGRHLGPGDRVTDKDLSPEDRHLIEEGRLIPVSTFDGAHSNADHVLRDDTPAGRAATSATPVSRPAQVDEEDSR